MILLRALPLAPVYIINRHRGFMLALLIFIISVSPRIHLGTLQFGKLLDIRYEDLLVVLLVSSWMLHLLVIPKKRLTSPLIKPILFYLLLAYSSTTIGLLLGWLEPLRAFFFFLKEVEFFLIFFIAMNFVRNTKDLIWALSGLFIGGLLNGFYGLYQLVFNQFGGMDDPNFAYRYYGVSMLGESGPAVTGTYFSLILFFSIALFAFIPSKSVKFISIVSAILSICGLIGSMSRTSLIGVVIVLPFLFLFLVSLRKSMFKMIQTFAIIMLFFSCTIVLGTGVISYLEKELPIVNRITKLEGGLLERYYIERVDYVYTDYFKVIKKSPVIGLGKSITGQQNIPGLSLDSFYAEAHNQYLRVLSEMGVIGLVVFLYIMCSIIKFSHRVLMDTRPIFRVIGLTCFVYTIFLLLTSLAQDVFVMSRTVGLFWILVGLVMVVYRWKQEKLAL